MENMYSFNIQPTHGRIMWPKSGCAITIIAPKHHTQIGKPKKKRNKTMEDIRELGSKITRVGKTVTCAKCQKQGHNARTCKGQTSGASGSNV